MFSVRAPVVPVARQERCVAMARLAVGLAISVVVAAAPSERSNGFAPQRVRGCGEVCVPLICEYYERSVSEEQLAATLKSGPHGEASAEDVKNCLERLGFASKVVRGDYSNLMAAESPLILYIRKPGLTSEGHFAVVQKDKWTGRLLAFDPLVSSDPVFVERAGLQQNWTGVAILVERSGFERSWVAVALAGARCVYCWHARCPSISAPWFREGGWWQLMLRARRPSDADSRVFRTKSNVETGKQMFPLLAVAGAQLIFAVGALR